MKMLTRFSPRAQTLTLKAGLAGPAILISMLLIEGATRPGYNAWTMAGSSLSLGPDAWMQVLNFLVSGFLITSFALGVNRALPAGARSKAGAFLLGCVGVALIMAGIFPTDPALGYPPGTPPGPAIHTTVHGILHWMLGGFVVFSGLPAACFVFALRWYRAKKWRLWAAYSLATGLGMLGFFAAFAIASVHGGMAGLYERVSLALGMAWIALLALRGMWEWQSTDDESDGSPSIQERQ